ncbi:MAG: hypothetical protein HY737_00860 [Candidatus Omnitrophica bacterium]|nr:hypothetical protein [Candidatus Omnitrophota bacterium]
MRLIQTSTTVPLSSVKPLEEVFQYRAFCLEATRRALAAGPTTVRARSPVSNARLEPWEAIEGLPYSRCPDSGSLLLSRLPADSARWAELLREVSRHRVSSRGFYPGLAQSRADHVHAPKVEWMLETMRLHGLDRPRVLEVTTPPSAISALLQASGRFSDLLVEDEMALAHERTPRPSADQVEAAMLCESLDRVDDPAALLRAVAGRLVDGGLLFVTALVASGFDLAVLGCRSAYLYPPDRANCFSLRGLSLLLERSGFALQEVSTPGMLDVEIIQAHLQHEASLPLSVFERQLVTADHETQRAFQTFLQQQALSSFARLVGRKHSEG